MDPLLCLLGDGRRETGDGRWETGDGRRETGDGRLVWFLPSPVGRGCLEGAGEGSGAEQAPLYGLRVAGVVEPSLLGSCNAECSARSIAAVSPFPHTGRPNAIHFP